MATKEQIQYPAGERSARPAEKDDGDQAKSPQVPGERFVRAYEDYVRQLRDIWLEAQKAGTAAGTKHGEVRQALMAEHQRKLTDLWRKYGEETQKIAGAAQEERQRAMLDSQSRYQNELMLLQTEAARKWEAAAKDYQEAMRAAANRYSDQSVHAYQKYLDVTKSAWQATDTKALDPWNLAGIGQVLAHAACQQAARTAVTR